jgi:MerR family mercuric resistance operon transcriptional regulator
MTTTRTTGTKLTIGKLAHAAGVGVETVRYYQRRGLLEEPVKPAGHHRTYSEQDLARLGFISHAKAAGFTLREIETLLSLGNNHCSVTKTLAEEKLHKIEGQITDLMKIQHRLEALIKACGTKDKKKVCGLFKLLLKNGSGECCKKP